MSTKSKLNIFQVLARFNKKNRNVYTDLSDEERKGFHPLVIMRWLSGTSYRLQVMMLNEYVNPYVFSLNKHPELLSNLMVTSSSGTGGRVKWIKQSAKRPSKTPNVVNVVSQFYGYNKADAQAALPLLNSEQIMQYAEHLGIQPTDIKLIKKELKSLYQ